MDKRTNLLDPTSCLNKAETNEPIFVLRANDPYAAAAVRHWATMAEGDHRLEKVESARAVADDMLKWLASKPMGGEGSAT